MASAQTNTAKDEQIYYVCSFLCTSFKKMWRRKVEPHSIFEWSVVRMAHFGTSVRCLCSEDVYEGAHIASLKDKDLMKMKFKFCRRFFSKFCSTWNFFYCQQKKRKVSKDKNLCKLQKNSLCQKVFLWLQSTILSPSSTFASTNFFDFMSCSNRSGIDSSRFAYFRFASSFTATIRCWMILR